LDPVNPDNPVLPHKTVLRRKTFQVGAALLASFAAMGAAFIPNISHPVSLALIYCGIALIGVGGALGIVAIPPAFLNKADAVENASDTLIHSLYTFLSVPQNQQQLADSLARIRNAPPFIGF
jgi:hypothetical protein